MLTGITFRKAAVDDAKEIARIHLVTQQQAYREILRPEYLTVPDFSAIVSGKLEKLQQDLAGQTVTLLAENRAGQTVAYASGGPRRDGPEMYAGELYNIFVLPEYQGQGIGSELFLRIVEFLMKQEKDTLLLWVIKNTAATNYYQHLQGRVIAEREITIDAPLTLECYGWNNLLKLRNILAGFHKNLQ